MNLSVVATLANLLEPISKSYMGDINQLFKYNIRVLFAFKYPRPDTP